MNNTSKRRGSATFIARVVLMFVLVRFVTGCATVDLGDQRTDDWCTQGAINEVAILAAMESAKNCCNSIAELPFTPLTHKSSMALSRSSPVFDFPTGRSRFLAFDLRDDPRKTLPLMPAHGGFALRPGITCDDKSGQTRLVARTVLPMVTWLDSAKRTIQIQAEPDRAWRRQGETVLHAFVFTRPAEARYMVIHFDKRRIGEVFTLDAPRETHFDFIPLKGSAALVPVPRSTGGPREFVAASTATFWSLFGVVPADKMLCEKNNIRCEDEVQRFE